MSIIALIPAAGTGRRMGKGGMDKPFLKLKGKPLVLYSIEALISSGEIDRVVLVLRREMMKEAETILANYGYQDKVKVTEGDNTRTGSVRKGLIAAGVNKDDIVVVHDAARPLITPDVVVKAIEAVQRNGAVVVGVPCASTIKQVDKNLKVEETPDRSILWEAQTPQVFKAGVLDKAYRNLPRGVITDDSALVEHSGAEVHMVQGRRDNIKITVMEDIAVAEAVLSGRK